MYRPERTRGTKLVLVALIAFLLSIPLFSVWLLVYDRQTQSREATRSITEGWGSEQTVGGPELVIPYETVSRERTAGNRQSFTRTDPVERGLTIAPVVVQLASDVRPEIRRRSIYQAIVYTGKISGQARFEIPRDVRSTGIDPAQLDLARAELRFELTDPRALGPNPRVVYGGRVLQLEPAGGSGGGAGFVAFVDARELASGSMAIHFSYDIRGTGSLRLQPEAADTRWQVHSTWPNPSFGGDFLPTVRRVDRRGFDATYRIGNLALGRSLVRMVDPTQPPSSTSGEIGRGERSAEIAFIEPVDPYAQVNRATKYGFLFIGFTFLVLLMFDVVGGVHVSSIEYLLTGAGLVLFFVLLLALAEIVGFTFAYIVASSAIGLLNTAYAAAILSSWRRAAVIGGELALLYTVLFGLLSLEAYSLLIGSVMLFVALAAVMYATRSIDWSSATERKEIVP